MLQNNKSKKNQKIAVLSFYSFINLKEIAILQSRILFAAKRKYVHGTIILANEGFNGSISGKEENVNFVVEEIRKLTKSNNISIKLNYCNVNPFSKIKVKLKNEIVALKFDKLDIENSTGKYINGKDWSDFISRDDVVTIDVRNHYEVKLGTFKDAINPKTSTFSTFPEWAKENFDIFKNKKVAMFCTGGIRCEKSTALFKHLGIEDVYHLKGGILQYLQDTKNESSAWKGECFVFDDRGAVSNNLSPSEGFWVQKGQTAKKVSMSK